jgi:beta-mannanase
MKVNFVWHSWAAPRSKGLSLQDFYPGDEFVDWIGISLFQQLFPWSTNGSNAYVNWGGDASDVEHVLEFAAEHRKPTMIAER